MKEKFITICALTAMILVFSSTTKALPTTLYQVQDLPTQDTLEVPLDVHELGVGFPTDELIVTQVVLDYQGPGSIPCPDMDNPSIPNALVYMFNATQLTWYDVWYVGDGDVGPSNPLETYLSNYDGIVNGGLAFKIDSIGLNKPLIYESITQDNQFEPGEIWAFVIQDYLNVNGLSPGAMGSPGVGTLSLGDQLSSGSIIAIPAPGAILLGSIGVGLVGWLRRKRTL